MSIPFVPFNRAGSEDTKGFKILWAPQMPKKKDQCFRKRGYETPLCFHLFCSDRLGEKDSEFLKTTALVVTRMFPEAVASEVSRTEPGWLRARYWLTLTPPYCFMTQRSTLEDFSPCPRCQISGFRRVQQLMMPQGQVCNRRKMRRWGSVSTCCPLLTLSWNLECVHKSVCVCVCWHPTSPACSWQTMAWS